MALFVVLVAAATASWPQPEADVGGADGAAVGSVRWEQRLEALSPADPMAYFELAEEVADAAGDEAQVALARHLFGLSGALDPQRLGRSACLAVADLEPNEYARQRLLALAALLDRRPGGLAAGQSGGVLDIHPEAALAVSEAISFYRRGDGTRALKLLERPGAADLLEAWGGTAFRGGAKRFVEDCRLYRGSREPTLTDRDLTLMLRFEAAILAGVNRTWTGDLLLGEGRPLIEVDPDRIEEALGVDGSRPCYRGGRWEACD
ncbi:MAG: hypothetical protein ACYS15_01500 [Planctomycetota bacterium]|jgi:hypothetical protein